MYYKVPISLPPLQPDDPASGHPSDHNDVLVRPIPQVAERKLPKTIKVRRFPQSKLDVFGQIIGNEKWEFLNPKLNPTQQVELFEFYSNQIVDTIFPEKCVKLGQNDKPYYTEELKTLKRRRCREYVKNGKSFKYKSLVQDFQNLMQSEISKYKEKILDRFKNGKIGSIYPLLRKLGNGPNESKNRIWHIPEQVERQITPLQCVEEIANFFASISQEYAPINIDSLPPNIRYFLTSPPIEKLPVLCEYEVYLKIQKARKPNSFVKGEVPPKVTKLFQVEFSAPATIIFNNIIATQKYPNQWKVEYGTPIPKTNPEPPGSFDDVRIISKTHFFSKVFESFVLDWMLPHISPPILILCSLGASRAPLLHTIL